MPGLRALRWSSAPSAAARAWAQALDLLHRCYPDPPLPRGAADSTPCVRQECGDCLAPAPATGRSCEAHDALVMGIVGWLDRARGPDGFTDPLERADDLVHSLSRQRRFEEAQRMREARGRTCSASAARTSRWSKRCPALRRPVAGRRDTTTAPAVRLNLVWDGTAPRDRLALDPGIAEEIEKRLDALCAGPTGGQPPAAATDPAVAVPQRDLDTLLAVRRWFNESEATGVVILPGRGRHP